MEPVELAAQGISILAMSMNVLAYQQKSKMRVLLFQFLGTATFFISYLMLGGIIGAMMNLVAALRAVIYMNEKRIKTDSLYLLYAFFAVYAISYVLAFTVFGKEATPQNLIIELLPIAAMVTMSISYRMKSASAIRLLGLISSPAWLIYNVFCLSIGGILSDLLSMLSIIIGMLRLDKKNNPSKSLSSDSSALDADGEIPRNGDQGEL